MKTVTILIISIVFYLNIGCSNNSDIDILLAWMTGSFSSAEQAEAETNYYDIRLEMVQIWKERNDEHVWGADKGGYVFLKLNRTNNEI